MKQLMVPDCQGSGVTKTERTLVRAQLTPNLLRKLLSFGMEEINIPRIH
jgi:hypothetical protein